VHQGFDVLRGHGGASGGAAGRSTPLVEEDAGTISAYGMVGVVIHNYSPAILRNRAHLLGALPVHLIHFRAIDDLAVIARVGIVDALDGGCERHVQARAGQLTRESKGSVFELEDARG
jgi:hypothetical protein